MRPLCPTIAGFDPSNHDPKPMPYAKYLAAMETRARKVLGPPASEVFPLPEGRELVGYQVGLVRIEDKCAVVSNNGQSSYTYKCLICGASGLTPRSQITLGKRLTCGATTCKAAWRTYVKRGGGVLDRARFDDLVLHGGLTAAE